MSIVLVMPSNHLILCHPLVLLPSIFPSIRLFSHESALHIRWPSIGVQSIRVSEHPGLIFRMDWLDLLAVQGTLKSILQHHSPITCYWQILLDDSTTLLGSQNPPRHHAPDPSYQQVPNLCFILSNRPLLKGRGPG